MNDIFETPNAKMRTYASAALTGSEVAVWSVEMAAGASGPLHTVSNEQVIVVIDGRLSVTVDGVPRELGRGDSAIVPAGAERRIANDGHAPAVSVVSSLPGPTATVPGKEAVPIPWAA